MREAADAAWDHKWDAAIGSYQVALAEFPEDTNALAGMGLALVEGEHLEEALNVYGRLTRLAPDDPLALEKNADVLERLGRLDEAGRQYVAVADIHLSQRNVERAIKNWERAISLLPNEVRLRSRLVRAYEKTGQIKQAVREYIALAAILQRMNHLKNAGQALQRALQLDPTNEQVRNNLAALRAGSPVDLPEAPAPTQREEEEFKAFMSTTVGEVEKVTPTAEAAEKAMGVLAGLIFDSDMPEGALASVANAIELQRSGDPSQAANTYERAMKSGVEDPAVWLNLGLVYQRAASVKKAIKALDHVTQEPEYAVAANLEVARMYIDGEDWDKSAHHLVQALQYADLTVAPGDPEETNAAYAEILNELDNQDEQALKSLSNALLDTLDSEDWQKRLLDMRGRVMSGEASGVIQMLLEPGAGDVANLLDNIDQYMERGMLAMAMEEAHYAIEISPWYLPAHARMAEILTKEGRTSLAAAKYNMIANSYMARGEQRRAADMYNAVLQMDPMDLPARKRVIELLMEQKNVKNALKHYEEMAESYLLMADTENARKTYQEAISIAQQARLESSHIVNLFHHVGDLDTQRLDWRQALRSYEQIIDLDSSDEKANVAIVELHYRMEDSTKAIEHLDKYLGYCIQNNKLERVAPILEEQVRNRPDEIGLRQRLARVYREQQRIPEAIAQMDALGELLLEAGRQQEAVETIRNIVELNPPDVDGYRQLLRQIETAGSS